VTHVQIQFAIDDPARADQIIDQLLVDRVVACGQRIGPVVSRYWWQGSLERAEEWLVLLKTRAALGPAVLDAVTAAHPYETPEVVVVDLGGGAPGYLAWIDEVTGPAGTIGRTGTTEE
jgi:periplasmic divalent cation tolerance protein